MIRRRTITSRMSTIGLALLLASCETNGDRTTAGGGSTTEGGSTTGDSSTDVDTGGHNNISSSGGNSNNAGGGAGGGSTIGGRSSVISTSSSTDGGSSTGGSGTASRSLGGQVETGGGSVNPCVGVAGQSSTGQRAIAFGTNLNAKAQICESWQLAQTLAKPSASTWRTKGDQRRTYRFAAANTDVAYRVCVPTNWDGVSKLPLAMFLHGAGNDESSYLDQNNKQMVTLANEHGYVLVSPLGYNGAYGNFLRLPAVFGQSAEAQKFITAITQDTEHTNELSEKDVTNVLELVLNEYPIDRARMFLMGHSMGSGGTWYIGAKYSDYWTALAPMSGPFVQETGYLWDNIRNMPIFVTEGTQATSLTGSRTLRDWMTAKGFKLTYQEVTADHPGMVPLVLPSVFDFFDSVRATN